MIYCQIFPKEFLAAVLYGTCCRMYDFDRNGTMSFDGVGEDWFLIGLSCFLHSLRELFDQKKNGRFRLDDFISLYIFLQSARNLFSSFDTVKQGTVTLDLNQFVFCTANCRI
ncbi:hypothetical protein ACB092_07G205600 [Castanea dentata]